MLKTQSADALSDLPAYRPGAGRVHLTTGQVARQAGVAPRTVHKWMEAGRLKGFRLPGCRDRRFDRHEVDRFLAEHGMRAVGVAVLGLDAGVRAGLAAQLDGPLHAADTAFELGCVVERLRPAAVVVDVSAAGRGASLEIARVLRERTPAIQVVLVWPESGTEGAELDPARDLVCPATAADVVRLLEG